MKPKISFEKIRFKAFRAIDDKASCERYLEGHQKVLRIFDLAHITSANVVWMKNPNCYIIMAESLSGDKVFGGARIQISDYITPLPIEEAVSELDPKIHDLVKDKTPKGTGELCGLWNSREVAGLGIGSIFLGKTCVSVVNQLNLATLIALCAPATLNNCIKLGFEVETSLGNNGTFYYPKLDLIATALIINNTKELPTADPEVRDSIFDLRYKPNQVKEELSPRGEITIEYELLFTKSAVNASK